MDRKVIDKQIDGTRAFTMCRNMPNLRAGRKVGDKEIRRQSVEGVQGINWRKESLEENSTGCGG